jgi:hypothetical protein
MENDMEEQPMPVAVKSRAAFTPPEELSDTDIAQIHSGLLIPNAKAILSMSREIRKWRGVENPDLI